MSKYIYNFLLIFAIFCLFLLKKMLKMPNFENIFMFFPKGLKYSYKCCKIYLYFSREFLNVFIILRNIFIILSQNTYLLNVKKCQNIAINTQKKIFLYFMQPLQPWKRNIYAHQSNSCRMVLMVHSTL